MRVVRGDVAFMMYLQLSHCRWSRGYLGPEPSEVKSLLLRAPGYSGESLSGFLEHLAHALGEDGLRVRFLEEVHAFGEDTVLDDRILRVTGAEEHTDAGPQCR